MSEREQKTLTTPTSKAVVVVKAYITAREMMPILKMGTANPTNAENIDKAMKLLEVAIVSVDGKTDGILDLIQDLPVADYIYLQKEVSELTGFQATKS